ncbi:hypothetical protein LTR50_000316 [Elasticomyces elasticus]|nr:hypothetical protein LTR50_000316 [Elasticomyces elasticus]
MHSLDELTDLLGQIWRSLGNLVLIDAARTADGKPSVMPQVLEIIALLHHSGMMPSSIYSYTAARDDSTLQQPPTLHLLSSQILTSLSDAAWRARESLVVEQWEELGSADRRSTVVGPEIPGSKYKVRVAQLGHEVWLELILWSCLHGGWITDGAAILTNVAAQRGHRQWSLRFWRGEVRHQYAAAEDTVSWTRLKYMFDTTYHDTSTDEHREKRRSVTQTLSSEVVAAFVDALLSNVRTRVGRRGIVAPTVLSYIETLQTFLDNSGLSLGTSSWDSVIVRLADTEGIDLDDSPGLAEEVTALSPQFGQEINSHNGPREGGPLDTTSSYVFDGTAASLGLMHNALRAHILAGNIEGALGVFARIQDYTDANKRKSIEDFFRSRKERLDSTDQHVVIFESNTAGIEYPAFSMQIPVPTLALFLSLVTDAKAFAFARWLLYSTDVDGPTIPEALFKNETMASALIYFATATSDKALLLKVIHVQSAVTEEEGPPLPAETLHAFLNSQISLSRWDIVENMLAFIQETPGFFWTRMTHAATIRVMLVHAELDGQGNTHAAAASRQHLSRARSVLQKMLASSHEATFMGKSSQLASQIAVLATVNTRWSDFCADLRLPSSASTSVFTQHSKPQERSRRLELAVGAFNTILQGVVRAYGSRAGRRLLDIWWPLENRKGQSELSAVAGSPLQMPQYRPDDLDHENRGKLAISVGMIGGERTIFRGHFKPNISTIRIIVQQALQEQEHLHHNEDWIGRLMVASEKEQFSAGSDDNLSGGVTDSDIEAATYATLQWTIHSFRRFGLTDEDIRKELYRTTQEAVPTSKT